MPRRAANVNQADVQRIIRAHRRENVPFRITLQPCGAAVFEPANSPRIDENTIEPDDLAEDL